MYYKAMRNFVVNQTRILAGQVYNGPSTGALVRSGLIVFCKEVLPATVESRGGGESFHGSTELSPLIKKPKKKKE